MAAIRFRVAVLTSHRQLRVPGLSPTRRHKAHFCSRRCGRVTNRTMIPTR